MGDRIPVRISGKCLRQMFHPCEANFIVGVCKGRCCEGSRGIKVTVHPDEESRVLDLGAEVVDGYIVADKRGLCPFKTDAGMCSLHGNPAKPFGCRASPFTLNKNDTMIVRNRYRLLRCFSCEGSIPAYQAHRWSLGQIFGEEEASRIAAAAEAGFDFIHATIGADEYRWLKDNDARRHRDDAKHAEIQAVPL